MTNEKRARALYSIYRTSMKGMSPKGDKLPTWTELYKDPKHFDAWLRLGAWAVGRTPQKPNPK